MCLAELCAFAEGQARGEDAIRLAEAAEHPYSLAYTCGAVGHFYLRHGTLPQAIRMLERGLTLGNAMHLPMVSRICTARLGAAYALAGRVSEALPRLEWALKPTVAVTSTSPFLSHHAIWLGEVYVLAGRAEEANQLGQRALEVSQARQQQGYQAYALRLLGESSAHGELPDVELAEAHYRQALALAEELGMRPLAAHCHLGLGTLYARISQREPAYAELSTAIALYRAMDMTFWLPQAEAALAQVSGSEGAKNSI
jgi:tetratricopeptide (TPR) repeat protein